MVGLLGCGFNLADQAVLTPEFDLERPDKGLGFAKKGNGFHMCHCFHLYHVLLSGF